MLRAIGPAGIALAALLIAPGAAQAQLGRNQGVVTGPVVTNPNVYKRTPNPAPPALPGAHSPGAAADAEHPPSDLPPTEALFDAINRGDMAAARDAITRGADIEGQNVLGQTPIDVSVDLGRNDITFLLLSMRGAGDSGQMVAAKATAKNGGKGGAKPVAASVPKTQTAAVAKPSANRVASEAPAKPQQSAHLQQFVSSDPGTPAPQAGFLGFGRAGQP
jgi:hypothetical protein